MGSDIVTKFNSAKAWTVVLFGSLFFFYLFIQMNMFNTLSDSVEQSFNMTAFQLGLVAAFYLLTDSVLLYPVGVLSDRFSSRKLLIFGMSMCIISPTIMGLANNAWLIVIARIFEGTAAAFCLLSILRLAAQWFPAEKMSQVSGVVVAIGMLGGVVSQTPLAYLVVRVGWRSALFCVSGLGVLILIAIILTVKDASKEVRFSALQEKYNRYGLLQSLNIIIRNKNNWFIGFYACTMNLPIMILAGLFGRQYMMQARGLDAIKSSSVCMMIFIGTIVGSVVFGFITDWAKNRKIPMLFAAIIALAIILAIMYLPTKTYLFYLVIFFLLGFFGAAQIICYAVTRESNKSILVGSALGFVGVIIMGISALLQPLTGWLINLTWSHKLIKGIPAYSINDFNHGLIILVIGFVVSIMCVLLLPETYGHH